MSRLAKCNHCGLASKEWGNKKDRICKSCYRRIQKSKINNTQYVRIIDLPEKERQKCLNKRVAHKIVDIHKQIDNKTINKNIENSASNEEKEIVYDDIKNVFKSKGIKYPLSCNSILPLFKQMKEILESYNDFIKDYLNAEDILNKMERDYKHAKEYYNSVYQQMIDNNINENLDEVTKKKNIWEERHNTLLMYRRDIKNIINEYYNGGRIIFRII